jgi:hypothetical protein
MKTKNAAAQSLGKLGGTKTAEKYGSEYMTALSHKAVMAKAQKKAKNENT